MEATGTYIKLGDDFMAFRDMESSEWRVSRVTATHNRMTLDVVGSFAHLWEAREHVVGLALAEAAPEKPAELVWAAARRTGLNYHAVTDERVLPRRTRCARSTGSATSIFWPSAAEAEAAGMVACPRCYTDAKVWSAT